MIFVFSAVILTLGISVAYYNTCSLAFDGEPVIACVNDEKISFLDFSVSRKELKKIKNEIEKAITPKTKAIVVVHYAGISPDMDKIMEISKKYNLKVVEDAAQGFMAKYKEKYLGTIGDIGCYSFHETKNYSMGEGLSLIHI